MTGAADAAHAAAQRWFAREVVSVLGLPFDTFGVAEAVERLRTAAFAGTRCFVSTPNLNFLIAARADSAFADSVLHSDMSLPDGAPIVRIARMLGLPLAERVAGSTVFEALRAHPGAPLSVYFFGGPPGVAEAAAQRLDAAAGGLRCVGFDAAGHGSVEALSDAATLARINASGAQFVVVALGAKKGQAWIERNAAVLAAPLLCHLGAVVNFVAGSVARAPRWVQRAGLEWLWRIKEEPALWRRYAGDGAALIRLAVTHVLPNAWLLRRRDPGHASSEVVIERRPDGTIEMRLSGAWTVALLGPLRRAFAEVALPGARISLQMRDVAFVDNAFVGLLLLAVGRIGRTNLRLLEPRPVVRSILRCNAVEFLLDPAPAPVAEALAGVPRSDCDR